MEVNVYSKHRSSSRAGAAGLGLAGGVAPGGRHATLPILLVALAPLLWACGDDDGGYKEEIPEGCNPLAAAWDCLLPYPSDVFLVDDSAMPGGKRVVIPSVAQPVTEEAGPVDFFTRHPADGFGILPQILALFPVDVDDSNLVFHTGDIFESTGAQSTTVLLEADTGLRVLHFAELDPRADDPLRRGLSIRPLERLESGTRYIVAIRRLLQTDGKPVPPAPGFAALRDGRAGSHPVLGQLVDHYEGAIFAPLAAAGIQRDDLLLAWDFTTATEESQTRDLLRVRELVMQALEANPPSVTVTDVTDDYDTIHRRVRGRIEVPHFMEEEGPGASLYRGGDGQVAANGTIEFAFSILIPRSVADASPVEPARTLQFGHGFFGGYQEFEGGYVRSFLQQTGMVGIGIDWAGMSTPDLPNVITDILVSTADTLRFLDRVHQGMANQIAVTYALKTTLAALPELRVNGTLAYNPDEIYYYGISQGHILGGTYMALTPHVSRAVFSVGACSFPFMMMRSSNFSQFLGLIELAMPDYLDHQKFVALAPTMFERIDPIMYAPFVIGSPLEGGPAERFVLMQIGIGDAQVPNVASHVHARALGLAHLEPAPRSILALPTGEGPLSSALVEFDFNLEGVLPGTFAMPSSGNVADESPVHEGVRRLDAAIRQIDSFFHPDGEIVHTCDGPCDPE